MAGERTFKWACYRGHEGTSAVPEDYESLDSTAAFDARIAAARCDHARAFQNCPETNERLRPWSIGVPAEVPPQ